jgi:poly(3-hydroxybutyrate) depolymerase
MWNSARRRVLLQGFLIAALGPSVCGFAGEPVGALRSYNADISDSSISGISSGAYMAVQFGTAWSSVIKGVGIVAGGPYYCAQAAAADVWNGFTLPVVIATGPCMTGPAPDLHFFTSEADAKAASGEIDPTSNLSRQKIYLFHGFNDSVVAERVTDATADFYRHYLGEKAQGNLFYQETIGAGHSQVLAREAKTLGLNSCAANESPFINACKYDQAGIILQHIYGALNPPHLDKLSGTIKPFAQAKYTESDPPAALSMGDEGYVFVPEECEKDQGARCRVHIALHGCKQDAGHIGRLYVDDAGYNAWADANRIIVLYPQTSAQALNPQACWDWWSYISHDDTYVTKSGRQIQILKAMLDALTSGYKPAPAPVAAKGAAPARLLAIDVTDQAVDLAWTPVEGVDLYRVFRAGADGSFAPVATVSGASFADWGLPPSSAWRWRVSAVIGGVEGPPSIEAAAETLPRPTACGSPGHCPVGNP